MALAAVFFDVGDTLVEGWAPRDKVRGLMRDALVREYGAREWYERFFDADIEPQDSEAFRQADRDEQLRQETLRWYEDWFKNAAVGIDDVDLDRVRSLVSVPLDLVSALTPGAADALRWCKSHGLKVALVTNTLSRGDREAASGDLPAGPRPHGRASRGDGDGGRPARRRRRRGAGARNAGGAAADRVHRASTRG